MITLLRYIQTQLILFITKYITRTSMAIDTNKIIAGTPVQSLGYREKLTGTYTSPTFSFFSGTIIERSFTIPLTDSNTATMGKIRVTGLVSNTTVNNRWMMCNGAVEFGENLVNYKYGCIVVPVKEPGLIRIRLIFYNNTASSTQNVPDLTFEYSGYSFAAPW